MAFLSGSQVNPALGRTDFTPFLQGSMQGSQMAAQGAAAQAQGVAGLGAGIAQGMERYKQNKEMAKKQEGVIKAFEKLSSGFEVIAGQMKPELAKGISDIRAMVSDPKLSVTERAAAADYFMQRAPNLLNAGLKLMEQQSAEADAARRRDAEITKMQAAAAEEQRRKTISVASDALALGQPVPFKLSNEDYNQAVIEAARKQKENQRTVRQDVGGVPTEITLGLGGELGRSVIQRPPSAVESPEDAARKAGMVKEQTMLVEDAGEFYKNIKDNAAKADENLLAVEAVGDALNSGKAKTGLFAGIAGPAKLALEAITGKDQGATEQIIAQRGIAGLAAMIIQQRNRGQGSMSNADRDFFLSGVTQITDTKKAIEYTLEVMRENSIRAKDLAAKASKLRREGKTAVEVQQAIEAEIESLPMISQVVKERVMGKAATKIGRFEVVQ